MIDLDEIQHDALVELFNIGVGKAAASMSGIIGGEVTMSVPSISFLNRVDAAEVLAPGGHRRICGVSQHYEGLFDTEAILMFPEEKSLDLVRLMVGERVPLEELSEMEQEAMSEIGNIILNSCVGSLANMFASELRGSLPVYHAGTSEDILDAVGEKGGTMVMMLHIEFVVATQQIHGYVAFLLDVSSLHNLKDQINKYIARMMG